MPATLTAHDIVFYDGTCGLCHGATQWIVNRDKEGIFHYAPIGGDTFKRLVSDKEQESMPGSIAVRTLEGKFLVRSDAALYIARKLAGFTGRLASVIGILPHPILDLLYRGVAASRYRIFGRRTESCPLVAPELRARFLG